MNGDRIPSSEADFTVVSSASKGPAVGETLPRADSEFARDCYRWFVDAMNENLLIINENSTITYVNVRFARMLGYHRGDILGHQVTDFMDEAAQDFMAEVARRATPVRPMQRNAAIARRHKLTWLRCDNRPVPTLLSVQVMFDRTGRYRGSLSIITELTVLKGAEENPVENVCKRAGSNNDSRKRARGAAGEVRLLTLMRKMLV